MYTRIMASIRRCCRLRYVLGVFVITVSLQMSVYTFYANRSSEKNRRIVEDSWDESQSKMLVRNIRSDNIPDGDNIDPSVLHKIQETIFSNNEEISLQVENHENVIKFNPAENDGQDLKPPRYQSHSTFNKDFEPQRLDSDNSNIRIKNVQGIDPPELMEQKDNILNHQLGVLNIAQRSTPPSLIPGDNRVQNVGGGVNVNGAGESYNRDRQRQNIIQNKINSNGEISIIETNDRTGGRSRNSRRTAEQRSQRGPPSYNPRDRTGGRGPRPERGQGRKIDVSRGHVEFVKDDQPLKDFKDENQGFPGQQSGARGESLYWKSSVLI